MCERITTCLLVLLGGAFFPAAALLPCDNVVLGIDWNGAGPYKTYPIMPPAAPNSATDPAPQCFSLALDANDDVLYCAGAQAASTDLQLIVIDGTSTGQVVGSMGLTIISDCGLAYAPSRNTLFLSTLNVMVAQPAALYTVDIMTATASKIGDTNAELWDITWTTTDQKMYGIDINLNQVFTVNVDTGMVTALPEPIGIGAPGIVGMAFSRHLDEVYLTTSSSQQMHSLNRNTGTLTTITALGYPIAALEAPNLCVPPTAAPTTAAPTMAAPTTAAPTTAAPTTASPTTGAPTTAAPTTAAPTTAAPTTGAPTTAAPTTAAPTTAAPTTVNPTSSPTSSPTVAPTAAPTSSPSASPTAVGATPPPTTAAPSTLSPTAAPTTLAPTTQAPTTQSPTPAPTVDLCTSSGVACDSGGGNGTSSTVVDMPVLILGTVTIRNPTTVSASGSLNVTGNVTISSNVTVQGGGTINIQGCATFEQSSSLTLDVEDAASGASVVVNPITYDCFSGQLGMVTASSADPCKSTVAQPPVYGTTGISVAVDVTDTCQRALPAGAIAGIALGAILLVVLVVGGLLFLRYRRDKREEERVMSKLDSAVELK